jgi:hypothetical protein
VLMRSWRLSNKWSNLILDLKSPIKKYGTDMWTIKFTKKDRLRKELCLGECLDKCHASMGLNYTEVTINSYALI